jgi:hypothetical protein
MSMIFGNKLQGLFYFKILQEMKSQEVLLSTFFSIYMSTFVTHIDERHYIEKPIKYHLMK